jgi:hypothetical protein
MDGTRGSKPYGTAQEIQCNQQPPAQHNAAYTLSTVTLGEANITAVGWGIRIYEEYVPRAKKNIFRNTANANNCKFIPTFMGNIRRT